MTSATQLGLNAEQLRLTENSYKGFLRGGAALAAEGKQRLAEIDASLSQLSIKFGNNVLAATGEWLMALGADDLDGLPDALREAAAGRALAAGDEGRYHFTLDRSDYESFLAFSSRRDLRERIWRGFTSRCDGGPHDNWPVIAEILALRAERAGLLGYADHSDYALEDSMAGAPDVAQDLLEQLWEPGKRKAAIEAADLRRLAAADGVARSRALGLALLRRTRSGAINMRSTAPR